MALANRPRASGAAIRYITLSAPADSPAMVTLAGSPPNAAMLRFTQRSACDLIEQAVVARDVAPRLGAQRRMREVAERRRGGS